MQSALHFSLGVEQCCGAKLRIILPAAGLQHSAHVQPIINCIWIMRRSCCSSPYCCCCFCCCSCIPASPAESAFCGLCGARCDELAPTSTEASTACAWCSSACICMCSALVWVAVDVAGILESYILLQQFVLLLLLLPCSACNIVSPPFCVLLIKLQNKRPTHK